MKKKIIGIFVCMFLLISSFSATITAIESTAIIKKEIYSSPIPDEDTLKNAIIERIELMQSQNYNIKFIGLNWTDPDGPFEGGLDDMADIISLIIGVLTAGFLMLFIKNGVLKSSQNLFLFVLWIINYSLYTYETLIAFGEAFDIIDNNNDGL